MHSSADPTRQMPAADLSIHALVNREHDSLARKEMLFLEDTTAP